MDDLVDREWGGRPVGMVAVVRGQFLGDAMQPFVELRLRPGIECRKAADDPRLALSDDQFDAGHDEQRRTDDRQAQAVEDGGQGAWSHLVSYRNPNAVQSTRVNPAANLRWRST